MRRFHATPTLKKNVLYALVPVVAVMGWLVYTVGQWEVFMPASVQFDELRLPDPLRPPLALTNISLPDVRSSRSFVPLDTLMSGYAGCRRSGQSNPGKEIIGAKTGRVTCEPWLRLTLEDSPGSGSLWLELAVELTRNNGIHDEAIAALRRSFELAPREDWIVFARTVFLLPIWDGLPQDIRATASAEILALLTEDRFVRRLALIYARTPSTRKALGEIMPLAVPDSQHLFLKLVNQLARDQK